MFPRVKKFTSLKNIVLITVIFLFVLLMIGLWKLEAKNKVVEYKKMAFGQRKFFIKQWQGSLRSKLIELSGASLENPQASVLWHAEDEDKDGYREKQLKLLFNKDKEVLCHLLTPKEQSEEKSPAIIFFPGHGTGIKELLEEPPVKDEPYYQQSAAKYLAEKGLITFVCEPWAFWSSSSSPEQFGVAVNETLLKGKSIMGIYIDQARAEIDFLQSLTGVDSEKIGIAGVSFGGAVSFYTAAIDERITASFISGFLTSFEISYFHYGHSVEMIIPAIYQYADLLDIAGLIAPRQIMFDNGEKDDSLAMTANEAEKLIEEKIRPIFKAFGAQDNVKLNKTEKGHVLDREAAYEFFNQAFNE